MKRIPAVFWILLLAAGLRIYGLADESLWLDEALINERILHDYKTLLTDWDSQRQGPLYPVIAKAWCDQFGNDEFNLRLTAALFGIIAVFMVYRLGKELFGKETGLWAAFFAALSPFMIYFSQEARPYTLYICCSLAAIQYFVRIPRGSASLGDKLLFIFFTFCALYSHPYGPFLALTFILMLSGYAWLERESFITILRRTWISAIAVALLYAPMFFIFARTFLRKLDKPTTAGSWLLAGPITQIPETFVDYFMSLPFALAVYVLIGFMIGQRLLKNKLIDFPLIVPLSMFLSFMLAPWIISATITPIYLYKYTAPALGGVLVLLGYALSLIPWKPRIAAIIVLTVFHILPLYNIYTKVDKDPWRQTAALVEQELRSHDMILLMPTYASSSFNYYYHRRQDVLFRRLRHTAEFRSIPDHIERVWFIFAHFHTPLQGDALFDTLSNWGSPAETIRMAETLPMNPHRYFASDIDVTRFDRK
ncbi:glycosyltransferase family 39 protein [bacterium]|nr:glycosyltransferase family 39 protein [bacterium]